MCDSVSSVDTFACTASYAARTAPVVVARTPAKDSSAPPVIEISPQTMRNMSGNPTSIAIEPVPSISRRLNGVPSTMIRSVAMVATRSHRCTCVLRRAAPNVMGIAYRTPMTTLITM